MIWAASSYAPSKRTVCIPKNNEPCHVYMHTLILSNELEWCWAYTYVATDSRNIVATCKLKHHSSYVYVYHSMSLYDIFILISIDGATYQREHITSYWKDADSGREWGNCGRYSVSNSVCVWYISMWLCICVVKPVIEEVFWFQVVVNGNVYVWPLANYFNYV